MKAAPLLQALLWLVYPLAILFGLQYLAPRYVALLIGLALLLRFRRDAGQLLAGLSKINRLILMALLGLAGITFVTNSESLLRFYPAGVNLGMLLLFGLSLKYPPSMIERFARLRKPDLPEQGVRYTQQVTKVWCVFFILNGLVATYTAVYSSRETWALYNGLIAYLLMGALFAGEWLVRRRLLHQSAA